MIRRLSPVRLAVATLATLSLTLTSAPALSTQPVSLSVAQQDAARSNAFALDLFKRMAAKPGNAFMSPWSVRTALSMASAGARGKTLTELSSVLRLEQGAPGHSAQRALHKALTSRSGTAVTMANRLWVQMGFMLKPAFKDTVQKFYASGTSYADFAQPKREAARIKAWIGKNTGGHIRDLVKPQHLNPQSAWVLTNATHFKAAWANPFDGNTQKALFTVRPGYSVSTPMMGKQFKPSKDAKRPAIAYAQRKTYEVLEMPYASGAMSMVVLLPTKPAAAKAAPSLDAFVRSVSPSDFTTPAPAITAPLIVAFPKFKLSAKASLGKTLAAMGMPTVFGPEADFKNVATGPAWIDEVLHQAYIDVSETGTEAAAATAVMMVGGMAPPVKSLRVDRPFVYAIRDNATGALLYMGRMDDPTL